MQAEKASVYLNNFKIVSIEENNLVNLKMGSELLAFDKSQHKNSTHEYFKYEFQPKEETTFHFLYIVPDAALKNNLCLLINPTGAYGSGDNHNPDDKKFVKLETP